jgi:hypothetical protein
MVVYNLVYEFRVYLIRLPLLMLLGVLWHMPSLISGGVLICPELEDTTTPVLGVVLRFA